MQFKVLKKPHALTRALLVKSFFLMNRIAIILLVTALHATAAGHAQQGITLSEKKAPLEKIFKEIKRQTGYSFWYDYFLLKNTPEVTITVKNASLEKVLGICLAGRYLSYKISQKTITIVKGDNELLKQAINLSGKVVNEKDEPLAGATVTVRGTTKSAITDASGEFTLINLEPDAWIIISNVGYETRVLKPAKTAYLLIRLQLAVSKLDEVQVIAYGTVSRRLNTGDGASITGQDIERQPTISNPLEALEGRVAGLFITQNTGVPGANFTVRLRGQNSIASGNDPLYIIDGVPFVSTPIAANETSGLITGQGSPLGNINPFDIERVDVLKDADATAIYGSRGANGVILITTKKGKAGKTQFSINTSEGIGKIARGEHLLNTAQYLSMRHEAFANDGVFPDIYNAKDFFDWDTTRSTDWQKRLIGGTASFTSAEGSVLGGNENTQFLMGGGLHRQTTVFPGDFSDQKGSAHMNLVHTSANHAFKMTLTASYMSDNNNLLNTDLTHQALNIAPDAPLLYDSTGKLNWANSTWTNPYSYLLMKYVAQTKNLISNAVISYRILPGLELKSSFGYTDLSISELSTTPASSWDPSYGITTGSSIFANNNVNTWIIEPQANYNRKTGPGTLSVTAGITFQQNVQQGHSLYAYGFTSDALLDNIAAASTVSVINSSYAKYHYNAFFGRINYNLYDKYLINLTGRRDGSSRFGPGKQFANFGAAGAAWIFSRESFLQKRLAFLSFGKIRGSFGVTGNDQIGDYLYLDTYTATAYPYQGNGGLSPTQLYNPDFRWELNKKFEAGLDLGFLKDRALLSIVYFRNRSSSQLVGYSLPPTTGFSTVQYNLPATVQNTGWEFELSTTPVKTKNLNWSVSGNISFPKNKLVSYPNLSGSPYVNQYVVGQPLNIVKAFHYTGVDPVTGLYTFMDVNKDGQITYPEDLTAYKKVTQSFYGGLQNSITLKSIELIFLFQFVKQTGHVNLYNVLPGYVGYNQPVSVLDRWQKQGDIAPIQRFTQTTGDAYTAYRNAISSDQAIGDASFIRLKNLSLTWQLPIKNIRIYLRGQNLLTFTRFKGLDPENQSVTSLPPLKTLAAGIQITF